MTRKNLAQARRLLCVLGALALAALPAIVLALSLPKIVCDERTLSSTVVGGNLTPAADDAPLLYIGYLSAPGNREKRDVLRETCFPRIRAACLAHGRNTTTGGGPGWGTACAGGFFVGRPGDVAAHTGKLQGANATATEIALAESLAAENAAFGDLELIPLRDAYADLPLKTLAILRAGAASGVAAVLKIDDDMCPDMEKVLQIARHTPRHVARYVGQYQWRGTEYRSMQGADGSVDPYMSGPVYIVSGVLARAVAFDDWVHSVLYMPYGSSSEDVNMGKWFAHANRTHPELEFVRQTVRGLASPPLLQPVNGSTAMVS